MTLDFLSIQHRISFSDICSPLIVSGPSSINVSDGGTGVFTCQARDVNSILWNVNGRPIDTIEKVDDDQIIRNNGSSFTSTMAFEIQESQDNNLNNSNISCFGYCLLTDNKFEVSEESAPALLLIQG